MANRTLECKFTCHECGITDAVAWVPARKDGQDVAEWMEKVCIPAICDAHDLLTPGCRPKTLGDLKIPMLNQEKGIGYL